MGLFLLAFSNPLEFIKKFNFKIQDWYSPMITLGGSIVINFN